MRGTVGYARTATDGGRIHGQATDQVGGGGAVRGLTFAVELSVHVPAAVEDGLAAYAGLLESGAAPSRVLVAGDSAGGGLTVAALLAARDQGLPQPAAVAVFSPWADISRSGASMRAKDGTDPSQGVLSPDGTGSMRSSAGATWARCGRPATSSYAVTWR